MFKALAPLACLALFASCQSMSDGVFALEGRAIVYEDTEIDDTGGSFTDEDIDLTGYGVHADLMTPIVDLQAGVDQRDYEDEGTTELSLGARRRFLEFWKLHPYIEGNLRYALDLDNGIEEDDYFGWNAGVGALLYLTDSLFLNFRLVYETLDVDLGPVSTDADGLVGTVGVGFAFL